MCPPPELNCHIPLVTDYTFFQDKFLAPFFSEKILTSRFFVDFGRFWKTFNEHGKKKCTKTAQIHRAARTWWMKCVQIRSITL